MLVSKIAAPIQENWKAVLCAYNIFIKVWDAFMDGNRNNFHNALLILCYWVLNTRKAAALQLDIER